MSELAKVEETQAQVAPVHNADQTINLLERIALSPDLPVERMAAIMDMQERQMNKAAEQWFNRAFAAAMSGMKPARKSGLNKHTKQRYSTLADLVEASRPALSAHGLALNWKAERDGNMLTVTAVVRHEGGWKEETSMSAPVESGKGQGASMNAIQAHGSTETYLKRYTGFAILGMSSEDFEDDGSGPNETASTISADQFIALRDALEESGMNPIKFHAAYGHEDPANADLQMFQSKFFNDAMTRLKNYSEAKKNG